MLLSMTSFSFVSLASSHSCFRWISACTARILEMFLFEIMMIMTKEIHTVPGNVSNGGFFSPWAVPDLSAGICLFTIL